MEHRYYTSLAFWARDRAQLRLVPEDTLENEPEELAVGSHPAPDSGDSIAAENAASLKEAA